MYLQLTRKIFFDPNLHRWKSCSDRYIRQIVIIILKVKRTGRRTSRNIRVVCNFLTEFNLEYIHVQF